MNFQSTQSIPKLALWPVLILYWWVALHLQSFGQIPVEVMLGQNQVQHEFFFFKDLDQKRRFNLFSMARFAVDYQDPALNSSFVSSQLTYNLNENWGISSGGTFAEGTFTPLVALSYSYFNQKGDLFINIFPTVLIGEELSYELFGLVFYTPRITDNLSLFSQVIFGTTLNQPLSEHIFSYQQLRLGVGIKDWFQTGIGLDQNFFGGEYIYGQNLGIFIRKEL